uniref:F-box domain-containing protein n=1 Tax=Meloidogyne incognita TaxID=6306 RepID=A0A914LK50_MELIC
MTFLYLPTEVQLDIFKFFNYNRLCSIKQTNLYFRNFINEFEGKLAREEFDEINIDHSFLQNCLPHYKLIKPNVENFDFPLNEELEEKWKNGIKKPIRLYLTDQFLHKDIVILLSKEFILDGSKIKGFQLELPTFIRNKNQIKIVYYYLNKLFNCSFDNGIFDYFTFNPELIQLLFGNSKQFYIRKLSVFMDYNIGNKLKFVLNYLISSETLEIQIDDNDATKYTDILFKILMSGDKFNYVSLDSNNLQNLFDCILNSSD